MTGTVPIVSGQTWQGEWGEPGDTDYFTFTAGAGTQIRVTLDRTDLSLPPSHPDAPAPEILLVRPDGVVSAASDPLGLADTGTELEATLTMSGVQQIAVRTPRGSGDYLVRLEVIAEWDSGQAELGFAPSRVHLVTRGEGTRGVWAPALDRFGRPLSKAPFLWQEGEEGACPDGFCPVGAPVAGERTNLVGRAWYEVPVSGGVAHPLVQLDLPSLDPSKAGVVDRAMALARAKQAREDGCQGRRSWRSCGRMPPGKAGGG